jgi:hypothetical protein
VIFIEEPKVNISEEMADLQGDCLNVCLFERMMEELAHTERSRSGAFERLNV